MELTIKKDLLKINTTNKTKETKHKSKQDKELEKIMIKESSELINNFVKLMAELGLYNKKKKTYRLIIMNKTSYGFYAHLYLNTGLSFEKLKENKGTIEENLRCLWIMNVKQFQEYAEVKIVTQPLDENIPYENPKIKPWQMYMGLDFTLQPIINKNVNEICMFLLSGATRSGKTRLIYMILLSWILNCTPQEVELYITDIAKDEYINFEYVEHVKYYANEVKQLNEMMLLLKTKFYERKKLMSKLRKAGNGTNIVDYNKFYKNNKLAYCYILIDELSIIMPDDSDSQEQKDLKNEILDIIKMLEKTGAGMGMFMITATQKTSKEEMIPIIKNMSSVRISLRANDRASSEVIMGDSSAVGLAKRYAVYSLNGGGDKEYLFSPYLSMDMLIDLLKPYIKKSISQHATNNINSDTCKRKVTIFPRKPYKEILKQLNGYEKLNVPSEQGDDDEYVNY